MIFKRNKIINFICITLGCIIAFLLRPQINGSRYTSIIIIGIFYLLAMIGAIVFENIKQYTLKEDRIHFKSFFNEFDIYITDIDYIRGVFTDSRSKNDEYEFVLSNDEKPVSIDPTLLNKDRKSIITVLEDKYKIKVTRFL